jgi:ABC-type transport system involved in multi-copper enzyme maturation permease subunit
VKVPTVPVNPVLRRELVERMRGGRTAVVLTVYLLLLSGILYLVYSVTRDTRTDPWESAASQVASAGRGIFEWLVFFMVLMVLFLVPGVTSGAIAGERERQTLVPLQVTLLRPTSILLGKIGASTAFLLLLLVATTPLLAVSYLIGGVSIGQVLSAVAMVAFIGLTLAAVSAGISACVRRVQAATVLAYGFTLLLVVGTLLVFAAASLVDTSRGTDDANAPSWILLPNPLAAVADVIEEDRAFESLKTSSPFDGLITLIDAEDTGGDFAGEEVFIGPGGDAARMVFDENGNPVPIEPDHDGIGFLWRSMGLLAALSGVGVVIGARRLRTPAAAER